MGKGKNMKALQGSRHRPFAKVPTNSRNIWQDISPYQICEKLECHIKGDCH